MKKKQEGSLNLLKLLATCIIIIWHFQQSSGLRFEGKYQFYGGSFNWGRLVELFFILSGYFTYKYSLSLNRSKGFASFVGKKYGRFLPMLIITGVASCLMTWWKTAITGAEFTHTMWTILGGIFGFGRMVFSDLVVNNPTWYISILILCYGVFYCVTAMANRKRINPNFAYLATMIVGMWMYHVCKEYEFSMPFFTLHLGRGLTCFFEGLLLKELFERINFEEKPKHLYVWASVVYLVLFTYLYQNNRPVVSDKIYYLLCFTVFPCVIILFKSNLFSTLCSHKMFSEIGNIAYHAFMWHMVVIRLLLNLCAVWEIPEKIGTLLPITLVASFAIGAASCYTERAILNLSKKQAAK